MRSGGRILVVFAALVGLVACGTGAQATETPSCDTGLRFVTNVTDAAMGLRVMSVEAVNCGVEPLQLNGYPQVKLFGEEREPLDVEILDGSGGIASLEGFDDAPQPITVQPGERAKSAFVWRNTHASVDPPQVGKYVDMAAAPGGTWQPLVATTPEGRILVDLGSTGRLGVRAWYRQ
ncbi:DUF4232 domain-containing protein [Lentzea sp. NBC_00516]|uniref:DUF4232 domain-containing protein n=1 Tax=Lentzea sp. NBC_00516 TaxID=2903582 RepID=UPI002E7FF638|nr:DUF4232 domain-containing protein [Lentzea sp. NBC_00516]WUD24670.1 DUF4232 domain-containing protein [Lentzea sp. NBC_00516]